MRVELDYRKPENNNPPRGFIRLYPERNEEWCTMDTLLDIFTKECLIKKIIHWENTHYLIVLNHDSSNQKVRDESDG